MHWTRSPPPALRPNRQRKRRIERDRQPSRSTRRSNITGPTRHERVSRPQPAARTPRAATYGEPPDASLAADLQQLLAHGDAAVLVTVARVEGSAPREAGTKMIVTRDSAKHTIGGGHLEWKAIETARQVLRDGMRSPHMRRLERFALGPSLGQCCGGAVVLALRAARRRRPRLGHLARQTRGRRHSTVRSVSFGPAPDAVMLSDPEPGVEGSDCLLWDGAGFDDSGALLTETIAPGDFSVVLFGAGHVGAALVRVLATLPCTSAGSTSATRSFRPRKRCMRRT